MRVIYASEKREAAHPSTVEGDSLALKSARRVKTRETDKA
jgi:hypothetical protein